MTPALKGIAFGLLAQLAFVVGFTIIDSVTAVRGGLRTAITLVWTGSVAAIAIGVLVINGRWSLTGLAGSDWFTLALGGCIAFLVGELFFLEGIDQSSVSAVASTALAFPAIAYAFDVLRRRQEFSLIDLLGYCMLVVGFVILARKH